MNAAEAVANFVRLRQGDLVELEAGRRAELICAELKDKLEGWSPSDIAEVTEAADRLFPTREFEEPASAPPPAPVAPPEPTLEEMAARMRTRIDALPVADRATARHAVGEQLGLPTEAAAVSVEDLLEAFRQVAGASKESPDRGVPQGNRSTVEQQVVDQLVRRLQGLKGTSIARTTAVAVIAALSVELCAQNLLASKILEQLDRHALDPVRGLLRPNNKFGFPSLMERTLRDGMRGSGLVDFRNGLRSCTGIQKALLNVFPGVVDELRGRLVQLEPVRFEKQRRMFRGVDHEATWNAFTEKYREFVDEAAEEWGERWKLDFVAKVSAFLADYYGWD